MTGIEYLVEILVFLMIVFCCLGCLMYLGKKCDNNKIENIEMKNISVV